MPPQIGLKALLHTPKHLHRLLLQIFDLHLIGSLSEPKPTMPDLSEPALDAPKSTIKFLYNYGGKILPRYPDGKLRYLGGQTRVLAVHRSISFSELLLKLEELCGFTVRHLRCQLPAEDLDALVSITSDEDLANLIEEYDRASSLKIKAFLSTPRSLYKFSAPPPLSLSKSASSSSYSSASSSSSSSSFSSSYRSPTGGGGGGGASGFSSGRISKAVAAPVVNRCVHQMSPVAVYPVVGMEKSGGRNVPLPRYGYLAQGNTNTVCLINSGNHWQ